MWVPDTGSIAGSMDYARVILLCGGDKDSQTKDIAKAKSFWAEWKRRQV